MTRRLFLCLIILAGCQIDPVPKNIQYLHGCAQDDYYKLDGIVQRGDIIFRLGSTPLLGGLLDFSAIMADWTDSDFSHACVVLQGDDILIADSHSNMRKLLLALVQSGFAINWKKSMLKPQNTMEFIGRRVHQRWIHFATL